MEPPTHQELIKDLKLHIAQIVRETVNGKIDKQREEMQEFLTSFYEASAEQVRTSKSLGVKFDTLALRAEPALKAFENTTLIGNFLRKSTIGIMKLIILCGGVLSAWYTIKGLFNIK